MPENEVTTPPAVPATELARALDFIRQAKHRCPDRPNVAVTVVENLMKEAWPDAEQQRAVRWRLFALLTWLGANAPAEVTAHEVSLTMRAATIAASSAKLSGKTFPAGFGKAVDSVKRALVSDQN